MECFTILYCNMLDLIIGAMQETLGILADFLECIGMWLGEMGGCVEP
jgi:hypothetical protein